MSELVRKFKTLIPEAVKKPLRSMMSKDNGDTTSRGTLEIVSVAGYEVAFRKNTADEMVIADSFDHDHFFTGLSEYSPNPDHVIIDVGAHIGTFSLLAASKVPQGKVFAIEACRETFSLLKINAALNHRDNIDVSHLALSDKKGSLTLHYSGDYGNWGHSITSQRSGRGETVASDTLANFLNEKNITHCDLLKLNCEGAEFPILLSSSSETLQKFSTMLVLFHCDLVEGKNVNELESHLKNAGFVTSIRNLEHGGQRGWLVATGAKR